MNRKHFAVLLTLALTLAGQSPVRAAVLDEPGSVQHVDAAGAAQLLKGDPEVVVLDVRTPREFSAGHIKGATNVDFNADDFEANLRRLDTEKTYLVHCASGGRSTRSLEFLNELGFNSVIHLDGGFNEWERTGQPVEK